MKKNAYLMFLYLGITIGAIDIYKIILAEAGWEFFALALILKLPMIYICIIKLQELK